MPTFEFRNLFFFFFPVSNGEAVEVLGRWKDKESGARWRGYAGGRAAPEPRRGDGAERGGGEMGQNATERAQVEDDEAESAQQQQEVREKEGRVLIYKFLNASQEQGD